MTSRPRRQQAADVTHRHVVHPPIRNHGTSYTRSETQRSRSSGSLPLQRDESLLFVEFVVQREGIVSRMTDRSEAREGGWEVVMLAAVVRNRGADCPAIDTALRVLEA